jgi:GNAT superfamily N-acetyltransferase
MSADVQTETRHRLRETQCQDIVRARDLKVEISIKEADPADVDFLRESLRKLDDEMRELGEAGSFHRENLPGLNIEASLQRELFLLAVHGDEPCGFLSVWFFRPVPEKALVPSPQQVTISTLYVLPQFRRKGIASKLLGAAEAQARRWGAPGIGLGFIEGNHAAEAAYKKAGYVTTRHAMWRSLD